MGNNIGKIEDCVEVLLAFKEELLKAKAEKETPALVTPVGIKFMVNSRLKVVGLCFNDTKQVLAYSDTGVYVVHALPEYASIPVQCLPLTPCKYEDLQPGEFCWVLPNFLKGVSSQKLVMMVLPDRKLALADEYGGTRKFDYETISEFWRIGK